MKGLAPHLWTHLLHTVPSLITPGLLPTSSLSHLPDSHSALPTLSDALPPNFPRHIVKPAEAHLSGTFKVQGTRLRARVGGGSCSSWVGEAIAEPDYPCLGGEGSSVRTQPPFVRSCRRATCTRSRDAEAH